MPGTVFFESSSELATLTNTFLTNNTPTDPATVTLNITDPAQATTSYTHAAGQITKTGTGVYTKDIPCTEAGTWTYEWVGTGPASDAVAGTWEVQEISLGRLYCTIEALKSSMGDTRSTDNLEYHAACFAASRSLEQYCQRTFYRTPEQTRTLNPTGSYCLDLPPFYDLVSVTSVEVAGSAWTSGSYQLLCDDNTPNTMAGPEVKPYVKVRAINGTYPAPTSGRRDVVEITGVWGWPAVPWAVKKAAEIIAAETFKLKDSPGMIAAGYEDFDVSMLGADARRRFARFANPYRRHAFMVA